MLWTQRWFLGFTRLLLTTTTFFVKPLSALFSKAKEGVDNSIVIWFRKKYNLSPKDPRFLEMTMEEIQEEFLLDAVEKNPSTKLEDMLYTKSSDEDWMASIENDVAIENLRKRFEGKKKELQAVMQKLDEHEKLMKKLDTPQKADDFETVSVETR